MNIFKRGIKLFFVFTILLFSVNSVVYANEIKTDYLSDADEKFINDLKNTKDKNKIEVNSDSDKLVRVIIQTDNVPEIDGGKKENYKDIKAKILSLGDDIVFKEDFSYLISGFSLDIPEKYVLELSSIKGIKKVSIARKFYPTMSNATDITKATKVWSDRNYKGEGMVVSIIDTGIDIEHKDMKLSDFSKAKIKNIKSGYTEKIPYGYNYADGNDIVKDNDKVGKSMHGMHVAGIVAANASDDDFNSGAGIKGVAPEAQLLAMKVFSNNSDVSGAYEDAIVAAIEDSVKYGADVINMSLGTDNGFATKSDPEHLAIQKAREAGVIVVVSAGNAALSTTTDDHSRIPLNSLGYVDNSAVGSPSTSEYSLSVASSNNSTETGYYGTIISNSNESEFVFSVAGHKDSWNKNVEYEIVDVGLGYSHDYTNKDVNGKIVFITRGEITFSEKFSEAVNHGAIGIIVANNAEGDFGMAGIDSYTIPSITVSKTTGEDLKNKISSGNVKVKIDFHRNDYTASNEVSSFTSYGPAPELDFKPEILAPGGNIYSTINNNKYSNMSGTSMAAPHVAGLLALMLGELKNNSENIKDIQTFSTLSLINTATPLNDTAANTNLPVSPRRQGSGLVNVDNALKNKVIITEETGKATKALKEISGVNTFELTLTNYGNSDVSYNISTSPVLTDITDSSTKHLTAQPLVGANILIDKNTVNVPANSSVKVNVTLDVSLVNDDRFAEGYIYILNRQIMLI